MTTPSGAADSLVGALLGDRYLVEGFLSEGGMGAVYRARHRVLDKPLAIKVLSAAPGEVAQQRFLQEARSACRVRHENIVDITDHGILADGRPFLVMELLVGQPLDELIAQGPLPPARARAIARQIALGLQAVHDKGIVHRDLKPPNIFILDWDGADLVKVLDFGIAKVTAPQDAAAPRALTQQGTIIGTPDYMSPEQATGEAVDARADQYSLGCVLYEMLTAQPPFAADTAAQLLAKHVTAPVRPPRQVRPELPIPPALEALVLRAMEKEPAARFSSMRELAQALAAEDGPAVPAPRSDAPAPTRPLPAVVAPRRLPWALAAGVGVLASGLVMLLLVRAAARAEREPGRSESLATSTPPPPLRVEAPAPMPVRRPARPAPTSTLAQVPIQNDNAVPLTLVCDGLRPLTLPARGRGALALGVTPGRCVAQAPGFRSRTLSAKELRARLRRGALRIALEAL